MPDYYKFMPFEYAPFPGCVKTMKADLDGAINHESVTPRYCLHPIRGVTFAQILLFLMAQ